MTSVRTALAVLLGSVLSACGDVSIKPEAVLPKPLIVAIPADVGLIIPADTRNTSIKKPASEWTGRLTSALAKSG